jgi:hypothetical protein
MEFLGWILGLTAGGFFVGFGFVFGALAAHEINESLEKFYSRFEKPTKGTKP